MHEKIDTSTIEGKIAVMRAYADGKKIEQRPQTVMQYWTTAIPSWDWDSFDYQIKREPEVLYRYINDDGTHGAAMYEKKQKDNIDENRLRRGYRPFTWVKFVEVIED